MWSAETLEWIDLEITSFCNIRCKECLRETSRYREEFINKEYLSLELIKEKFKPEYFPNLKIVNFCGSVDEPTTHPQFFEIIEHFKQWPNVHINIATNGSLKTTKWWTQLANVLPSNHAVTFGIDGADETSEIYREGSNFYKVQKNWRAFIKNGGQAIWQFILFEHNEHQLEKVKELSESEGFTRLRVINSFRNENKKGVTHKRIVPEEASNINCLYAKQKRIFVNHMGNVIPCCFLNAKTIQFYVSKDYKDKYEEIIADNAFELGMNLDYNSIEDIIEGDFFLDIASTWDSKNPIERCVRSCKKNMVDRSTRFEFQ